MILESLRNISVPSQASGPEVLDSGGPPARAALSGSQVRLAGHVMIQARGELGPMRTVTPTFSVGPGTRDMALCSALPSEGLIADTVRQVPDTSRVFMSGSQLLSKSFWGIFLSVLSHFFPPP